MIEVGDIKVPTPPPVGALVEFQACGDGQGFDLGRFMHALHRLQPDAPDFDEWVWNVDYEQVQQVLNAIGDYMENRRAPLGNVSPRR